MNTDMADVYECYDDTDTLIYVGSAYGVSARLGTHEILAWWWPQVARVATTTYGSRLEAYAAEKATIGATHPRWNIAWLPPRSEWSSANYADYITARVNRDKRAWVGHGMSTNHMHMLWREHLARFGTELQIPGFDAGRFLSPERYAALVREISAVAS